MDLLREGCEAGDDGLVVAAFLLARQAATDFGPEVAPYLNYERWWRESVCKRDGFLARGNHLDFLRKLLVRLVPCEPLEFLKVFVVLVMLPSIRF